MPALKTVETETLIAVAADAATGASRRELMKRYPGTPERLINAIVRTGMGADEWHDALAAQIRGLTAEVGEQLQEDLRGGKISPNTKGILYGILIDKGQVADSRNSLRSASVNLTINNFSSSTPKERIIEMLEGKLLTNSGDSGESIPELKAGAEPS